VHFKSSWRLKAGPIQILVNRCVKKRGGVIGFIVVGVYDTVSWFEMRELGVS
jgi:hypothetical protein